MFTWDSLENTSTCKLDLKAGLLNQSLKGGHSGPDLCKIVNKRIIKLNEYKITRIVKISHLYLCYPCKLGDTLPRISTSDCISNMLHTCAITYLSSTI